MSYDEVEEHLAAAVASLSDRSARLLLSLSYLTPHRTSLIFNRATNYDPWPTLNDKPRHVVHRRQGMRRCVSLPIYLVYAGYSRSERVHFTLHNV